MEMDGSHETFVMSVPKVGCYFCGTRERKVEEVVEQMRRSDDSPQRVSCPENSHFETSSNAFIVGELKMVPVLYLNCQGACLSNSTPVCFLFCNSS